MLLINVHKLDGILAQPVAVCALEHQLDNIRRVLRLQREIVIVAGSAQHLGERREVDSECDIAIASVRREGLGSEHHRHERDVRIVHGLQRDAGVIAVEVAVLDKIFDCVYYLPSD